MNSDTLEDLKFQEKILEFWSDRAKILRVISHPIRLMILELLCDNVKCVKDINTLVPISQPHLSQHIAALREAGFIASYSNGALRCYYCTRPALVKKLIKMLRQEHPIVTRDRRSVLKEANRVSHSQKAIGEQKNTLMPPPK